MALLGAQLVITLVMVSLIHKVSPHLSPGRWMLCSTGLSRFLYPTDQQLKSLAGITKEKLKKNKRMENGKTSETFHVPRNLDLTLETVKVSHLDVVHLKYYSEFQWLFDFSVYAVMTYVLTEVYNFFYPITEEINLSMVWCSLVIAFAFKILLTLWMQYFKGDESVGERSTCIVTGFCYLLIAMMILIVDENKLEIGLDKAYTSFNHSASVLLGNQRFSSTGPASKIVLKFFLALWCGLLGSLFTFPGLRMSKMHWDTTNTCSKETYYKDRKFVKLLANISFVSPLLLVCLWIKPIGRDYFSSTILSGMDKPLLTSEAFDSIRLVIIVIVVLLKFLMMPIYLQSYLNLAEQRLQIQKREAGRITNVELQKKIAAVFYYLCVVTLQYLAPLMMCLFLTLMYKTLGGYTWNLTINEDSEVCSAGDYSPPSPLEDMEETTEEIFTKSAEELPLALSSLREIFTPEVFRGVLGLATWWSWFTIFATNAMGMFYQTYFANA